MKNTQEQKGLNQKYFQELIETSPYAQDIKSNLGEFKEWKEDKVQETLKIEDKDKIKAYEELEVKDLPKDWKAELTRLKELERKLVDHEQKKEELKEWTETFKEKNPPIIEGEIKDWEEKFKQTSQELEQEKKQHSSTTNKLKEWEQIFGEEKANQIQTRLEELETKLNEWTNFWGDEELEKVKREWEDLQQRPDISITEQTFYDDYARRLPLPVGKKLEGELIKTKEEWEQEQVKNKKLWWAISQILNSLINQRYAVAESALNPQQARQAIAKLLEETEEKWKNYLEDNLSITDSQSLALVLSLSFEKGNREKAIKILEWIKEARENGEYQTLFERWNGGKEYKRDYDFDGSLYLLGKRLEVREEQNIEVYQN